MKLFTSALMLFFSVFISPIQAVELSADLLKWANENPIATVAIEDDFPPFDYIDKNGRPTGVGELVRQQLSDLLPISLEVVSQGSFASQMDQLANKQVDMLSICAATEERSKTMLFSNAFLSLTPIVVVHEKSGYKAVGDIKGSDRIGIPIGYASISTALSIVNESNIVEVSDILTGIEMVDAGIISGFVTYLLAKDYFIQEHNFIDLKALPVVDVKSTALGFCVDKEKPELVALLNAGIEELGSDYFSHLQSEWVSSLNIADVKSEPGGIPLQKTVILSLVLLVILIFLMYRYAQVLASKFETLTFKVIYFSTIILALSFIFFFLGAYFDDFRERIVEDQKEIFDLNKEVTIKSLDDWYLPRLAAIKSAVKTPDFKPKVEQLVLAYKRGDELTFKQKSEWLQGFRDDRSYTAEPDQQHQVIMSDGVVLFNTAGQYGQKSEIIQHYPALFKRAFMGESMFIPSIDIGRIIHQPVVYIVEPIKNTQGEVIAVLATAYNATQSFSSLFNDARLGYTVESYGVNKQGKLLSESRFIDQLHNDKTVSFGESAILQLSVASAVNNPIAYDVQFQTAGRNLVGYQDYMGHVVAGQWSWIDKYNFMLVSEISIEEMYSNYSHLRNVLFVMMVLSVALITATSLFTMIISHRAAKINLLSKEKLEELVAKRTQALSMSEEKNSLIVDSVADGILGLDSEGCIVFFNKAAELMLGYKEADVLNKYYQDVLYACKSKRSDQDQRKIQINKSLLKGENLHVLQGYFCHLDGGEIPVSYSLSVIDDDNSPFKAVLAFQDISQRLLEFQRTTELLSALPSAIFLLNMDKKIVDINIATEQLLGYSKEEIVGKELVSFIPEDRKKEHLRIMEAFFAAPKYVRMGNDRHITVQTKSGAVIEVEAIFAVMELNGEKMVVLSALDITEANQTKKLLIEAKELADDASRSKSDFLANMSHEIRTPMNAIIGMSMLALQGKLEAKERNYVSKVHTASTNLLGIINDILDFSKIEAGKLELENQIFSLTDMLDNFSTLMGVQAKEKGIDLLFNIDNDVPLIFNGDLLRLNQILINLGGNAMKFTSQGEIILKVSISEIEGDRVKLLFSIKDSGIGISGAHIKKLFFAFSQADASTTRKYGGTGLGLSICKRLVGLMGGDIWAESIEGKGSEFFFTAWLEVNVEDKSKQILKTAQARLANKRLLIVDDSLMTLETLKEVAEGFGCEVFTANSGKEALLITEEISHLDFALIDWNMPSMNGLETSDALNKQDGLVIEHMILISSYDEELIREGDYIDRVDALLAKPITAQQLHQTLQASLGYEVELANQPELIVKSQLQSLAGAHILLVEDNELNQELATVLLEAEGLIVSHAANGEIAVSMVQDSHYDGILMDIQMPVMDGYEATKLIRMFNQDIPILAMTANAMVGEKDKVVAAGMNDYISKPINIKTMFAVLSEWVKVEGRTLPNRPIENTLNQHGDLFEIFSQINKHSGLATCNGNHELYLKILIKFESSNRLFKESFEQHLQAEQWDNLTLLVHSLKGAAGNIGAKTLHALLNDLEFACSAPEQKIDIQPLFDAVLVEFIAVNKELTTMLALYSSQKIDEAATTDQLSDQELQNKLKLLQQLVDEFDTSAQDIAVELTNSIADSQIKALLGGFISHLENFDFDAANTTLSQIKNKLLQ